MGCLLKVSRNPTNRQMPVNAYVQLERPYGEYHRSIGSSPSHDAGIPLCVEHCRCRHPRQQPTGLAVTGAAGWSWGAYTASTSASVSVLTGLSSLEWADNSTVLSGSVSAAGVTLAMLLWSHVCSGRMRWRLQFVGRVCAAMEVSSSPFGQMCVRACAPRVQPGSIASRDWAMN